MDGLCAAPGKVAPIFDHPLVALLDPEIARSEKLAPQTLNLIILETIRVCSVHTLERDDRTQAVTRRLEASNSHASSRNAVSVYSKGRVCIRRSTGSAAGRLQL